MDLTDRELIERTRHGDVGSFARLTARWQRKAYALAYRLTQDEEAAADIRQTAFLRAYERLDGLNRRAAFSAWLFRIVVNLCRDRHRSSSVWERVSGRLRDMRRSSGTAGPKVSVVCEQSETAQRVREAVGSLPAAVREVVVMRHYMSFRFTEIAEILGTPVSTVKTRMASGLRLLRESLENVES
jgi:RNA polymerase sigma-70 factor (ECF subfamily)